MLNILAISIGRDRCSLFYVQLQDTVIETDIDHWIQLEEQISIRDALIQDGLGYFSRVEYNDEVMEENVEIDSDRDDVRK